MNTDILVMVFGIAFLFLVFGTLLMVAICDEIRTVVLIDIIVLAMMLLSLTATFITESREPSNSKPVVIVENSLEIQTGGRVKDGAISLKINDNGKEEVCNNVYFITDGKTKPHAVKEERQWLFFKSIRYVAYVLQQ